LHLLLPTSLLLLSTTVKNKLGFLLNLLLFIGVPKRKEKPNFTDQKRRSTASEKLSATAD
jgi:hypothetical protein